MIVLEQQSDGRGAVGWQRSYFTATYLAMVAGNSHDLLKLVTVPVLDHLVFAGAEEVMCAWHKCKRHNGVAMRKYRFVAIAEVQPPNFDVLICRTSDDHLRVRGDVKRHDWQLVPIPANNSGAQLSAHVAQYRWWCERSQSSVCHNYPHERELFVQGPASAILGATKIIHAKSCHHNYKGVLHRPMGLYVPCGATAGGIAEHAQ